MIYLAAASAAYTMYSGYKNNQAAKKQAAEIKRQAAVTAQNAYGLGVESIGDLKSGIAMSGVRADMQAGQESLDGISTINASTVALGEITDQTGMSGSTGGKIAEMVQKAKNNKALDDYIENLVSYDEESDTATEILRQSRQNLLRDVREIQKGGDASASAVRAQGQQNFYSSIFGGAATLAGGFESNYSDWAESGKEGSYGSWLIGFR